MLLQFGRPFRRLYMVYTSTAQVTVVVYNDVAPFFFPFCPSNVLYYQLSRESLSSHPVRVFAHP